MNMNVIYKIQNSPFLATELRNLCRMVIKNELQKQQSCVTLLLSS